ncbi:transcriptional regulator SplA domain-containing protein [Evansella halocellulosilytica]|uniref:transcriptional regulator SplA domain-containing protein n=1 Tax=Evansella halocellulosilytica TaxID=2011013 RepID=UPI000BB93151|nr:transcriptional regulator SplA domain-containing protein [Evansella halocellulosilytica]
MDIQELNNGDTVYVIFQNPYSQTAAQIQEASIVSHPERDGELSLFLFEEHYSLTDEYAMFPSYQEAEDMYRQYFDLSEDETLY